MLWSEEKKKKKKTLFASNFALWFLSENCVCVCVCETEITESESRRQQAAVVTEKVIFFSPAALTLKKNQHFLKSFLRHPLHKSRSLTRL